MNEAMKLILQMMGNPISPNMMGSQGGQNMMSTMLKGIGGAAGGGMGQGLLGTAGSLALNAGGMAIPALPLIEGGISLVSGIMKQRQANKLKDKLNTPDPALSKFMGEIDRQRKSFETGSAYSAEIKELKNRQAATMEGITRAAKGNTGSALAAMEQVGLNTALGYGKIAEEGQQRQDLYQQMYGNMVQGLEQRKYQQNMDLYNQANIDARDSKIKGLQTLLNTAALSGKA